MTPLTLNRDWNEALRHDRNEGVNVGGHKKGTNKTLIATEMMIETGDKNEEKVTVLI